MASDMLVEMTGDMVPGKFYLVKQQCYGTIKYEVLKCMTEVAWHGDYARSWWLSSGKSGHYHWQHRVLRRDQWCVISFVEVPESFKNKDLIGILSSLLKMSKPFKGMGLIEVVSHLLTTTDVKL